MADSLVKGVYILTLTAVVHSCYDSNGRLLTCASGCCGERYSRYFCSEDAIYVAIAIGCLFGVLLIVGTVTAVCCCSRKQQGRQGQVLDGTQATTATEVVGGCAYPMVSYPPPAYGDLVMGYTNVGNPHMQMHIGYPQTPQAVDQKWQEPPPSYDSVYPS